MSKKTNEQKNKLQEAYDTENWDWLARYYIDKLVGQMLFAFFFMLFVWGPIFAIILWTMLSIWGVTGIITSANIFAR